MCCSEAVFFLQLKNCCWQLGSAVSSFTGETQIHNAKGISGYWRVFDLHTNVYQNLGLQCAGHYSMGLKYTNIFTNYRAV